MEGKLLSENESRDVVKYARLRRARNRISMRDRRRRCIGKVERGWFRDVRVRAKDFDIAWRGK